VGKSFFWEADNFENLDMNFALWYQYLDSVVIFDLHKKHLLARVMPAAFSAF